MAIKLTTGQKISLKKEAPGLITLLFGLGWDSVEKKGLKGLFQSDFDLDISILCLGENNKLRKSSDVVYYSNPQHPSEAISHLGDELTGEGKDTPAKILVDQEHPDTSAKGIHDKEQILINLAQVPDDIAKLIFFVNIYECVPRRQTFGQVRNAHVSLISLEEETEIARYNLSHEYFKDDTGIVLAEAYREDGKWEMLVLGEGVHVSSLQQFVGRYS
ncbi:MAG: TerD family protein [Leptolyngbyaceae bacterium]|nr:TerD family protein [Leptolyngbyaceae bacterium]